MKRHTRRRALLTLLTVASCRPVATPVAVPNDNRVASGVRRGDTLVFELDARRAAWRPNPDDDTSVTVIAFAAGDGVPRVPGPLLRVTRGTVVELRLSSQLPGAPLIVHGLRPGTAQDTLHVAPGATRTVHFTATHPGTYLYWASTDSARVDPSEGRDAPLAGAIVVDAADVLRDTSERIMVLTALDILPDSATPEPRDDIFEVAINGWSWPHTEALRYRVGDTVRWRVLNATATQHPMHLHGFHFTVTARGDGMTDTTYAADAQRTAVTEYVVAGSTVRLQWTPTRAGSWLFHCHIADHVIPFPLRSDSVRARDHVSHLGAGHARRTMAGLVMGIDVHGDAPGAAAMPGAAIEHRIRLFAQQSATPIIGDTGFARGYVVQRGRTAPRQDSIDIPGPLLLLTRGQRTAITVINRLSEPTSVHWHGMELESFYDGVAGWSGADARRAPMIAPGDSFVAVMTPPRAGTFIYHPHMDEEDQLEAGLFGALLVRESAAAYDAATDLPFVIGRGIVRGKRQAIVNGASEFAPLQLRAGTTYRLRFINIAASASAQAVLQVDSVLQEWSPRAKDGADVTRAQAVVQPSRLRRIAVGETYDFLWRPDRAMRATLEITVDISPAAVFKVPMHVR